ncbi:MAG: hypothetical protein ACI4MN_01410 [Candidatus Coproplasma sp.]
MAEERLIDTDKDKKYRIRKNADGEDELYIDDSAVEQEVEEVTFAVTEDIFETGESVDDADRLEELKRKRLEDAAEFIDCARRECEKERFASASEYLEKAVELDEENGEIYALALAACTRNFTDYSQIKVAAKYVEKLEAYATQQIKENLFSVARQGLEENIASLTKKVEELSEENTKQKKVRAEKFNADRNKSIILTCIAVAMLCVFSGLSTYFFLNIYSVETNVNLILGIVFACLAFGSLCFSGVAARWLITSARRVRLNKKDTSTKLGRELIANQADLDAFNAVYYALKG